MIINSLKNPCRGLTNRPNSLNTCCKPDTAQAMVFRNHVEIKNPGRLPHQLTLADLKKDHESFPANPHIAEPLFYAGYIERFENGITDMVKNCANTGIGVT